MHKFSEIHSHMYSHKVISLYLLARSAHGSYFTWSAVTSHTFAWHICHTAVSWCTSRHEMLCNMVGVCCALFFVTKLQCISFAHTFVERFWKFCLRFRLVGAVSNSTRRYQHFLSYSSTHLLATCPGQGVVVMGGVGQTRSWFWIL